MTKKKARKATKKVIKSKSARTITAAKKKDATRKRKERKAERIAAPKLSETQIRTLKTIGSASGPTAFTALDGRSVRSLEGRKLAKVARDGVTITDAGRALLGQGAEQQKAAA